jgi:acyl dehydratase
MTRKEFASVRELGEHVGREAAVSDWLEVSQERINQFAEATEDRQWIHTDPERAARESPFKQTIAHGFLTLSLLSELMKRAVSVAGVRMGLNYGLNRVRFVAPVPAGARLRGRFRLAALEEVRGGAQATWEVSVEREGSDKPCCVAEWLVRYYEETVDSSQERSA